MWAKPRRPDRAGVLRALCEMNASLDGPLSAERERELLGGDPDGNLEEILMGRLRIRDRRGRLASLEPNAAQRQYARNKSRRNILLKARQMGMTTYIAGQYFLQTILRPGTVTLQVAHTLESAQQIFRIVHRYTQHLPAEWAEELRIGRSNVREIGFASLDSRYIVDTAGNPNAGRGLTVHNLHASEVALWPGRPAETMAALLAAVTPDGYVDLESTPCGAGGYFYREWQRAHRGEGLTPHFFPWWLEAAYAAAPPPGYVFEPQGEDELRLMEREGLNCAQILYRRQLRASFGILAPQEYAEDAATCFLASGGGVFDAAAVDRSLRESTDPAWVTENGAERIWLGPLPERRYIIGADAAEGSEGGDYSAAVVVDAETGLHCAEVEAHWPVERFAEELARLGRKYNDALLVVERNNPGLTVLYALKHQHGYPRIYRHGGTGDEGKEGWPTTAQTKPQAIGALASILRDAPESLQSRRLLEQCRAYRFLVNGTIGAPSGEHDDLLMASAIAMAVRARTAGRNWGST